MKNNITVLFVLLLSTVFTLNAFSQTLDLQYAQVQNNDNEYPCIEVTLEPTPEEVKAAWEDFIKDNYDVKMKGTGLFTNKDVLYAEQVKFDAISSKEMDFFTRIIEQGDNTTLSVFGSFGYDIPISTKEYPVEFEKMETITKRFLQSYLPAYYEEWIENTQEKITDLQDNNKDILDEMEDNKKEIEKLKKRNEQLKEKLEENNTKITETQERLDVKKENFSGLKTRLNSFDVDQIKK